MIFENEFGEILLLLRHKQDPEGGTWGLVGGNIDQGEDNITAVIRETKEEIDFDLNPSELVYLKSYHWDRPDLTIQFDSFRLRVNKDTIQPDLRENENTEFMWIKPADAYKRKESN